MESESPDTRSEVPAQGAEVTSSSRLGLRPCQLCLLILIITHPELQFLAL